MFLSFFFIVDESIKLFIKINCAKTSSYPLFFVLSFCLHLKFLKRCSKMQIKKVERMSSKQYTYKLFLAFYVSE